jgi:heterodisulfide reductase subunit D
MIYFRGCVVRDKLNNIEFATKKILDKIGVDYEIMENEECCGSFLLRTGFQKDAIEVMKKNLKNIKNDKILVSCAGCYNTLKNDYKKFLGVELDVIHTSQLFKELIEEKELKPKKLSLKVTYHDPCHLGRHCGEYQAPRNVLESTANLVEMKRNKLKSRCCGAGGGVKSAYPDTSLKIAQKRILDVEDIDADILVTSCSLCILNLTSAVESFKKEQNNLKIIDLSELLLMGLNYE